MHRVADTLWSVHLFP